MERFGDEAFDALNAFDALDTDLEAIVVADPCSYARVIPQTSIASIDNEIVKQPHIL